LIKTVWEDFFKLKNRITELENTLVKIEKMCDHLEEDRRERDKVLCNIQSIRFEITKAYPKYMREV
jgi:hypothetical protein